MKIWNVLRATILVAFFFVCTSAFAQTGGILSQGQILGNFSATAGPSKPTTLLTFPVVSGNPACFSGTTGLLQDCGFAPNTLTLGTTSVVGGTTTRVLYDNAGKVGEYTPTQLTAVLNPCTTSLNGTVPAPGSASGKLLSDNCTWINPTTVAPATPVTFTTLQAAITAACNAPNAIVQIPTGSWSIDTTSGPLLIASPCQSIIIQGSGGTESSTPNGSQLTNNAAANDLFSVTTNGSVVLRDFSIGYSVTKNAATAAIRLNNASTGLSQQIIERVAINGGCTGIEVDNSFHFIIQNNLITSFGCEGITVTQPTIADQGNNLITGNKIWDVAGTAGADACILWNRGSGTRITNNRCLGAFNYGLHVKFDNTFGNDGALIVTGNSFEVQKLSGIFMERMTAAQTAGTTIGQMVIANNFFQSITSGGTGSIFVATSGGSPWVISCTITGNTIQNSITPSNNGIIEIDGASDCNVGNNTIDGTSGTGGIRVSGVSTNILVANNLNPNTTAATKYSLNAGTTLVDMTGMTVANLPSAVKNGSIVYATDGNSTNPITGGGAGAFAMRINGAWVGDLGAAATWPSSSITGTLQAAQEPAHTGDMTNTAGSLATTVVGINGHLITGAWTTYTPTVACVSGTLTTGSATGRYQQFGKTVVVQMDISITTNGTCATGVTATLPFAANVRSSIVGKEVATTGFMVIASALPAGTTVDIRKYDATYPGGNSNELVMEGVFESQ